MGYKSHPYYDNSDAGDWLGLDDEAGSRTLLERLKAEKSRLCGLALDRIRAMAGEAELAQYPHPEVNEFLFYPINGTGYRVYIEFVFLQRPGENTPDSDFWWAIVNCPYGLVSSPTGRREEYVIGLGWAVA